MADGEVARALTADPAEVGRLLVALVEDQWFDRKSARIKARKLAEALIGFANADGGTVVVGLHDGSVEGTRHLLRHRNELLQTSLTFTEPAVQARTVLYPCVNSRGEADELLVFDVLPGTTVHASVRDEVFLRVGDETRRLTFAQRRELLYDRGQTAFETEPSGMSVHATDPHLLADYAGRLGHPDGLRLLRVRGLAVGDDLTMAGCLLFAEHPEQVLPNAHIRVSRFRGTERGTGSRQNLAEDIRVEGPIPHAVLAARRHITAWQPRRRALGRRGAFEDIALVPEDAWLEGVVNAAVHRSYSLGGDHIHVDVFDDRIEIESPGRFPGLVDLQARWTRPALHATRASPGCAPTSSSGRSSVKASVACSRRCASPGWAIPATTRPPAAFSSRSRGTRWTASWTHGSPRRRARSSTRFAGRVS